MSAPNSALIAIRGLDVVTPEALRFELSRGSRFVVFTWCISLLVVTFRRRSQIHVVRPGESPFGMGLPYSAISLVVGWWGIPWGPIWTVTAVVGNARGGVDVTPTIARAVGEGPSR